MRTVKLVHPTHAREVMTEQEAARLRRMGWLELPTPKAVSPGASEQRLLRARRRAEGMRELLIWLPGETFKALEAKRQGSESLADVVARLVRMFGLIE